MRDQERQDKRDNKSRSGVIISVSEIDRISKPLFDRFDFKMELRKPSIEERAKAVDIILNCLSLKVYAYAKLSKSNIKVSM